MGKNWIYAGLSSKYLSRIYEVFDLNKIEYLREYITENILLLELNVLTTHSNIYTLIAAMIISFKCVIIEFYKALKKGYYK